MACSTAAVAPWVARSGLSIMRSWVTKLYRMLVVCTPASTSRAAIRLALVAEDVVLIDDHEGWGKAGEVVEGRPER
jgi:hypothetical protein